MIRRRNKPFGKAQTASGVEEAGPCLLLVVERGVLELLALGIGPGRGDGAALAIGGHDNSTVDNNFSTFLSGEIHCPVIDLLVRARVRRRIAADGIIFSVELARPFGVRVCRSRRCRPR